MSHLKIGEKVIVTDVLPIGSTDGKREYCGKEAVITRYDYDMVYPYGIDIDGDYFNWRDAELESIEHDTGKRKELNKLLDD